MYVLARRPVVVTLPDEIDVCNAAHVADQLAAAARDNPVVIIDMTATTFCDGAGTRAILQAYKRATDSGAELRLAVTALAVRRLFDLLSVTRLIDVYPSVKAARSAGGSSSGGKS